jgi:hypothetical protein
MHYSQALDTCAAHPEGLAPMTRASKCELIVDVLTPILALVGVMFLLFAPLYTVNGQLPSASYLSNGNVFSQHVPEYA